MVGQLVGDVGPPVHGALLGTLLAVLRATPCLWVGGLVVTGGMPGIAAHALYVLALSIVLFPLWSTLAVHLDGGLSTWLHAAVELLLGVLFAAAVGLPAVAVRWAGGYADRLFSNRSSPDRTFGQLYGLLALGVFVSAGGLRSVVDIWWQGLLLRPPGGVTMSVLEAPLASLSGAVAALWGWSVVLSGPLLVGGLLCALIAGLAVRALGGAQRLVLALPQLQMMMVLILCMLCLAGVHQAFFEHMPDALRLARGLFRAP